MIVMEVVSMTFGSLYGFRTNERDVAAFAESDEYSVGEDTVVDLILVGVDGGRRTVVVADSSASAVPGQAWFVGESDSNGED
jgi:hypothetical protein